MFDPELEHRQHVEGSFRNEFEAAYAISRLTQEYPRQQPTVDALVATGRFVLTLRYPVYCQHTDALLGMAVELISDHATMDEAQAAIPDHDQDPEFFYQIECKVEGIEPRPEADPNDIPF